MLAAKLAENDREGTILRIQERSGTATKATLKSRTMGLDHSVDLGAWELKTLMVKSSGGGRAQVHEVSLLET